MALAEVLRITHSVHDEVKVVEAQVESTGDKVEAKVQCVDEKVQVVIDGARGMSSWSLIPSNMFTFRWQGSQSNSPTDGK
jgi:hypothetical protein